MDVLPAFPKSAVFLAQGNSQVTFRSGLRSRSVSPTAMASSKLVLLSGLALALTGQAQERAEPLHVTVLYESNCPFCQRFIIEEVGPVINEENCLEGSVQFHWVAYGMGQKDASGQIQCQHGEDECIGNRVQLCAKKHYGETRELSRFVVCMEENLKGGTMAADRASYENCASADLVTEFEQCAKAEESLALAGQAGDETDAARPDKVPFAFFTDVPGYNLFGSPLKPTLCAQLKDANHPIPECCTAAVAGRRLSGDSDVMV